MNNLLELLENSADRYPDKIVYSDENESVSFSELRKIAKEIGTAVARKVQGLRMPIAIVTNHRVADLVAFAGVHYAGCFYIPLDGAAPEEFMKSRLELINPAMIIDAKSILELPRETIDDALLQNARDSIISSDPAYAIFTSGSTGVAKAAVISHGSVINLANWLAETFGFSEKTIFAGQGPFYFDGSVKEIYSTLRNGCTLQLVPKKLFSFPIRAMQFIQDVGANVLPWAVSAVKLMANSGVFDKFIPEGVTDVIFGGETMPASTLNIWKRAMPQARFANVYGPAEVTVDCSYYIVDRDFQDGESIPIGNACKNVELLLLDENQVPVSDGEAGEIYVRGAGVGLGYWRDPERTSEAFIQNPLNSAYRDIVYKTGDIAKYNENGELVFLSRADYQVKHMGSRIELGEIEIVATGVEGIDLVCCLYDKDQGKILLFYEGSILEKELAKAMETRMPRYMQPNVVIKVEEMPATPNGKIDRLRVKEVYYDGL
ncbi:MAG: AMP-binding protein [Oscillospiraceae bacterium]|nr:AMP-binding protein [Oscillospiraceae bacterium]